MARLMWVIKIREMRAIRLLNRQFDMYGLSSVHRVEFFAFTIVAYIAPIVCDSSSVMNFSDGQCGKYEQSKRTRIVGGTQARPGEFPWVVSIRQHRSHTCGGVIVNGKWIVTTAHCFCSGLSIESTNEFDVVISTNGSRDSRAQSLKIDQIIIHPRYNCSRLENDIALLELVGEVLWANAHPACFPVAGEFSYTNIEDVKAIAAGWGATNEDLSIGNIPLILHKVQLPILKNYDCQKWYESQNKTLNLQKSQLCAGYKDGLKDTCWADSGGPLMMRKGIRMVVVGLVSTGIGCARASLPGIYTRLSEYITWMGNTIRRAASERESVFAFHE